MKASCAVPRQPRLLHLCSLTVASRGATFTTMPVQSQPETAPRTVSVDVEESVVRGLRGEASRRNVRVARLIRDLLDVIVTDRLTTAVLDD
jgi:hypothetical protein